MTDEVRVTVPGRVNLMGDHTDTSGGLVCPMAIDRGTTIVGRRGGSRVRLASQADLAPVDLPLVLGDPSTVQPPWGRYAAGVVAAVRPGTGFTGRVFGDLPLGGGLSSSASLQVALALALGFEGSALELARLVMGAERAAVGVPCGLMDPLACAAGVAGAALRIDTTSGSVRPVILPPDLEVCLADSGEPRALADSAYARRRAEVQAAAAAVGDLRRVDERALDALADPVLRRRARHVRSENGRVDAFVAALAAGDGVQAGALMRASHASLAADMEVSTPRLDALVEWLGEQPGVLGARLTGAGFGGWVVALVRSGSTPPGALAVRAVDGPLARR